MITNAEFTKAAVFSFNTAITYSKDAIVSKIVLKKDNGNISLFAFSKGQALSEHTASFDAMLQVIDGQAEIMIGGNIYVVNNGESIIMPANITHSVRAIEDFKMILTMIKS